MTSFPDKTLTTAPGLKKQIGLPVLDILLAILLLATILPLFGGADAIHCAAGIFMLIGCSIHLACHGRWIRAVVLEPPKNSTPTLRRQRRLFICMLISGLLCGLSGLVSLPLIIEPFHGFLPLLCCLTPIHATSGLAFFSLNVYHLVLHRNQFRRNLATSFLRRQR